MNPTMHAMLVCADVNRAALHMFRRKTNAGDGTNHFEIRIKQPFCDPGPRDIDLRDTEGPGADQWFSQRSSIGVNRNRVGHSQPVYTQVEETANEKAPLGSEAVFTLPS